MRHIPFIDIGFETAKQILTDQSGTLIRELQQNKKLNPLEADLLSNVAQLYRQENKENALQRIKELLERAAVEEAERALERIVKFATHEDKQVAWVLFSRTIQFIPFDISNPLEGYQPQSVEIVKIETYERLSKTLA